MMSLKSNKWLQGRFIRLVAAGALLVVSSVSATWFVAHWPVQPLATGSIAYQAVWRSVLCIGEEGDCIGTAWVVAPGQAVTAQHVVGARARVDLYTAFYGPFSASIVAVDQQQDIAFLSFDPRLVNAPTLHIRPLELVSQFGEALYALGYGGSSVRDNGGAGAPSVRSGVFSQVSLFAGDRNPSLKTDVRGVPGDSGGPIVDGKGNVVGMHRAKDRDGVYSYAVPVQAILSFSAHGGDSLIPQ